MKGERSGTTGGNSSRHPTAVLPHFRERPLMPEALEALRSPTPVASNRRSKLPCCCFCQAELGEDAPRAISASRAHGLCPTASLFCSTRCRDCVLALAALHPSPLATSDFISTRTLLTDRLLDLWRGGDGPDPALVLQAALNASCGLASNDAQQSSG